jgi:parallel beta-helix repeat protein
MSLTTFPIPAKSLAGEPSASPARTAKIFGKKADGTPEFYDVGAVTNSYDLRHFGIVANGTTDDTAALQAAYAVIPAGSVVDYPAGATILQTGYVTIPVDHLTIRGNGCKIISNATGQDRKFLLSGRTGVKFFGLRIDGGEFTTLAPATSWYTYTAVSNPGTLHFVNSANCEISNCDMRGVNFPITVIGSSSDIDISKNNFNRYYHGIASFYTGSVGSEVCPARIKIYKNNFGPGLHPLFPVAAVGSSRDYTVDNALDSGAIKLRGVMTLTTANGAFFRKDGHIVEGNTINRPGEMGIEIQSSGDCVVNGNQVYGANFGISLSYVQRVTANNNVLTDCYYTGIEVDGNVGMDEDDFSSENITLANNVIDGRDEYGRPLHWINVYGIILGHMARNIVISGGSITYCLTGIAVLDSSRGVTISGVRIATNDQTGYGGVGDYTGGPWNQGIIIKDSFDVKISAVVLTPSPGSWQKMINLVESARVEISNCTITSNNTCVYVQNCTDTVIRDNTLAMGSALGGFGPAFITIDAGTANNVRPKIVNNSFIGTADYGINLYNPSASYSITGLELIGNSTELCGDVTGASTRFVYFNTYPAGTVGPVIFKGNRGPTAATRANSIQKEYIPVSGTVTDEPTTDIYFGSYGPTINLQSAVGYTDQTKTLYYFEGTGTLTIHPAKKPALTGVTAATDTLTKTAHGLAVNDLVEFISGTGFSGLTATNRYYVVTVPTADTLKVSATLGGSAISVGTSSAGVLAKVESISGDPADRTLTTVGQKMVLRSTGSDWIIVSQ